MGLHTWRGRPERLLSSRERLPKQGGFRLERLRLRRVKTGPGVVRRHIWRTPNRVYLTFPPLLNAMRCSKQYLNLLRFRT